MRRYVTVIAALTGLALAACSKDAPETEAPAKTAAPAPSPAAPAAAKQVERPTAEGKGYRVRVEPPAEAPTGTEAVATVRLTPVDGYHVNKEFPTSLEVVVPPGVKVAKARQTGQDAAKLEEDVAAFEVKFTAEDAGKKSFKATFKFAVCTETTCDPHTETLAWNVDVK